MSDTKKATPRPWQAVREVDHRFNEKIGEPIEKVYWRVEGAAGPRDLVMIMGESQFNPGAEANAALIVKAVNAYEDLVAALEVAKLELEVRLPTQCWSVMEQIEAALAKAKAGE